MPADLDLQRLRVLAAVARDGSLTAAARTLGMAQPSVSHHLSRLETEAGLPLLERVGRGVQLTEAGRLLADRAEEILGRVEGVRRELDACSKLSFFAQIPCREKARWQYCNNRWDTVPECATNNQRNN